MTPARDLNKHYRGKSQGRDDLPPSPRERGIPVRLPTELMVNFTRIKNRLSHTACTSRLGELKLSVVDSRVVPGGRP